MSTMAPAETETSTPASQGPVARAAAPIADVAPAAPMSRTMRRSGRKSTRVLAVLSLLVAVAGTTYAVTTATGTSSSAEPVAATTASAWQATGAVSDALRDLRPNVSHASAHRIANAALPVITKAKRDMRALDLPTSATPRRQRVLEALQADHIWIVGVRAVLANPRSSARASLRTLAARAASATALAGDDVRAARGTVSGTPRLLFLTRRPSSSR